MPTTTHYALRYPAATDPADVPLDIGNLAADTDAAIFAKAPGAELALAQLTVPATVTATTAAAAPALITAAAVTLDGATKIRIEFFCPAVGGNTSAAQFTDYLYDGATQIGVFCRSNLLANEEVPHYGHVYLTPSSGSHTYSVRSTVSGGSGVWQASAGGVSPLPTTLAVRRA